MRHIPTFSTTGINDQRYYAIDSERMRPGNLDPNGEIPGIMFAAIGIVPRNDLLQSLPAEELERLRPHLARVQLVSGQVLYERSGLIEHGYFVETGMISLVSGVEENELGVEVGIVGREGLVGCAAMFEEQPMSFFRALVQMPGSGLRIPVAALREAAKELPTFRRLGFRYLQATIIHAAQSAACNTIHPLQKRAARWLLIAHDRADGNELALTQEFLSNMLGVRRPGVTMAAGALQDAGLITYSRGRVKIIDRPGLERAACGCYRIVRAEYDRLLHSDATKLMANSPQDVRPPSVA